MRLFDTHCHLDFDAFNPDRDNVLDACKQAGVNNILVPGVCLKNWQSVLELCSTHTALYPALGLHPCFTTQHLDTDMAILEEHLQSDPDIIAIGEAGLDFLDKQADRQAQTALLTHQLALARKYQKPVVLHVRKAHAPVLELLKKFRLPGGIIHAFNGSLEQARDYMKLGFRFGFGGTLTYSNASRIHKLARELPLDRIVLETDSPDMPGTNQKGERNSPEYLPEYLYALAHLRQEPADEIAEQVYLNSMEVFGL